MKKAMTALFFIWVILIAPWLLIAPLAIMAFDSGPTLAAYVLVSSIWTYPLAVGIAAIFRKKVPAMALLPSVNFIALVVAG